MEDRSDVVDEGGLIQVQGEARRRQEEQSESGGRCSQAARRNEIHQHATVYAASPPGFPYRTTSVSAAISAAWCRLYAGLHTGELSAWGEWEPEAELVAEPIGGSAWESNPPPATHDAPDNGFEDRRRHQPPSASAVSISSAFRPGTRRGTQP